MKSLLERTRKLAEVDPELRPRLEEALKTSSIQESAFEVLMFTDQHFKESLGRARRHLDRREAQLLARFQHVLDDFIRESEQ
jgi:hypothetical protein